MTWWNSLWRICALTCCCCFCSRNNPYVNKSVDILIRSGPVYLLVASTYITKIVWKKWLVQRKKTCLCLCNKQSLWSNEIKHFSSIKPGSKILSLVHLLHWTFIANICKAAMRFRTSFCQAPPKHIFSDSIGRSHVLEGFGVRTWGCEPGFGGFLGSHVGVARPRSG